MSSKKGKGIQIQVKDTVSKKSKSLTVHNCDLDKLFDKIYFLALSIAEGNDIKVICYKQGDKFEKKIE